MIEIPFWALGLLFLVEFLLGAALGGWLMARTLQSQYESRQG